jgi:predicted permease
VAQVAASVLVLATAGVFVRSFQKAQSTDPGFEAAHLLTVKLNVREMQYSPARLAGFYSQLRSRVDGLPGVVSASLADVLPLGDQHAVAIPGEGEVADATVGSSYFRTMGIPLLRGREPQPADRNVAIVNEALARRVWPGQDPIGQSIRVGRDHTGLQVIGLTATGKYWSLNEPPRPFLYQISSQLSDPTLGLSVRTQGPPEALAAMVAQEIQRLNPDLPAVAVQTESERLRAWLEPQRAGALLLSILGLSALGLAVTGLYALLAQLVALRTAEIAVRVVLGASRRSVIGMLLRWSVPLIFAGTAAGIAASAAVARLLANLAGQVNPLDAVTVAAIAVLLAVVGAAATLVPAYRAVRIHPAAALRAE